MIRRLHALVRFKLESRTNPEWGWAVYVGDIPHKYQMDWQEPTVAAFANALLHGILIYAQSAGPGEVVSMEQIEPPDVRRYNAEVAADKPFPL